MTKKAEKIVNKYTETLELEIFSFEKGLVNFERCVKVLNKDKEQFENLISGMFQYDMLSKNDFKEIYGLGYDLYSKYYDKALDIEYNVA